jgi:osmotically-inducible protein OsmY
VFSEETPPLTDADLLQKVRSEAVGPTGNLGQIEVRVDEGTVVLVGPSIDPAREEELMERIEKVVGVTGIRNELRRATRVEESENH